MDIPNPNDKAGDLSPLGKAAFAYLRAGHPVIPLRPKDKQPLIQWEHYQSQAPTENEVLNWWQRWPDANIGLLMGKEAGKFAVDADSNESERLLEERGVPFTAVSRTAKGKHYIFQHPGFRVSNLVRPLEGLDIRGDGGFIVAPPSVHPSGGIYEWEPFRSLLDVEPALAPDWLLALLEGQRSEPEAVVSQGKMEVADILRGVPQGQRDERGYHLACHWLAKGLPPEEVTHLLILWAARCDPPIGLASGDLAPEKWARQKVNSALAWLRRVDPGQGKLADAKPAAGEAPAGVASAVDKARSLVAKVVEDILAKKAGAEAILANSEVVSALALLRGLSPGEYGAIKSRLKGYVNLKDLERTVQRRGMEQAQQREAEERRRETRVRDLLADAPAPGQAIVPRDWEISEDSVRRVGRDFYGDTRIDLVCPAPVVISGRLREVTDGSEAVRLAWWRDGKWRSQIVERKLIANARAIVELAGAGLPVTSLNAMRLVEYLADFEAANLEHLPVAHVSSTCGWQGEGGKLGFLWGRNLIRPGQDTEAVLDFEELPPEDWREDWVSFRGTDSGDGQLVAGLHAAGSDKAWTDALKSIVSYPRVIVGVYASFVPPLLAILGAPNFTIDWSYPTSTGKTTAERVAASVWGKPVKREPDSFIGSWDATRVWIERAAAVLNGLPVLLDDSTRAPKAKVVADTLYNVANGRGRGRGSPNGLRRSGSWCTVLFSTGETPVVHYTTDGGAKARTISLWGFPFGKADGETRTVVDRLNLAVQHNYGHAGPAFVRWIQEHRDKWEFWAEQYQERTSQLAEQAGDNPVAGRLAGFFAAIDITGALAHSGLSLPWDYQEVGDALWEDIASQVEESDTPRQALAHAISWAQAHSQAFWGRHQTDRDGNPRMPSGGWAGRWDQVDWEFVGFYPSVLRKLLDEQGFHFEAIVRAWRDRGGSLPMETPNG